jgi:3-phytase
MRHALRTIALLLIVSGTSFAQPVIRPSGATAAVPHDPDDPAIWVHPTDAARSLVLGTDKVETNGGLYVFGLDGSLRQRIVPLDRPNNVDVEYGVRLGDRRIDVAVLTERMQHRLRIFEIPLDGSPLRDLAPAGLPILAGASGEASEPMGIALYKRASDENVFVIVSPKTGPSSGYLWQYRLDLDPKGGVTTHLVRRFGTFSGSGEIEAVVVDDELGYVYYSDESFGIRKYHANPDAPHAAQELAAFGQKVYQGDREGLAIYSTGPRTGYILSSDQISDGSRVRVYRREGTAADPHQHVEIKSVLTSADDTDGLDVTSRPLPNLPRGLLVMMNSQERNFQLYSMEKLVD